jgi:hypothetical protein
MYTRMRISLSLGCLLTVLCLATADADRWTDQAGKYQVEATFVRMEGDAVVLRRENGSEVTAPVGKLDDASRRLAFQRAAESKRELPAAESPPKIPILAEINRRARGTIQPDDNSVVAFWSAIGADNIAQSREMRRRYLDGLGGNVGRPEVSFISWADYVTTEALEQSVADPKNPFRAKNFSAVDKWLARNEQPLDGALAAFQKPEYYSPLVVESNGFLSVNAQILIALPARDIAYALLARAHSHLRWGQFEAAIDDAMAVFRWARLVSRDSTLVCVYISHALEGLAVDCLCSIVHDARFKPALAEQIQERLARLPPRRSFVEVLAFEKAFPMDAVVRIAAGGPQELMKFIVDFVGGNHPEAVAWAGTPAGRAGIEAAANQWSETDRELWVRAAAEIADIYNGYERNLTAAAIGEREVVVSRMVEALRNSEPSDLQRLFKPKENWPDKLRLLHDLMREGKLPAGTTAKEIADFMK